VSGPAGVGKTRLLHEMEREWSARGGWAATARCLEGSSWSAALCWLRELDKQTCKSDAQRRGEHLEGALAFDLPVSTADRHAEFSAFVHRVESLAKRRPVMLVLEDLQWADDATLGLVRFFVACAPAAAVVLVASCRAPLGAPDGPALEPFTRNATRLDLGPVGTKAARGILESILERHVEPTIVRESLELAGGVPLFLREIALALNRSEDGQLSAPLRRASASVSECLRWHLGQVGGETTRLLQLAAVAGEAFDARVLAKAAGLATHQAVAMLAEAVSHQVVSPTSHLGYRFQHALLRGELLDSLSDAQRRQHHWQLGCTLLDDQSADVDSTVERIAHHLRQGAVSASQARQAVTSCERAAQSLVRRFAFDAAAREYAQLSQLLELAEAPQRDRVAVLVRAAECTRVAGRSLETRDLCQQALELARRTDDAEGFGEAAFVFARNEFELLGENPPIVRVLEEALQQLPHDQRALRGRLSGQLAQALALTDRRADMQRACQLAMELAAGADRKTQSFVQAARLRAYWGDQSVRSEWRRWLGQLVLVAREANEPQIESLGLWFQVVTALERGDALSVQALAAAARAHAERVGDQIGLHCHQALQACLAIFRGSDDAEHLLAVALQSGQSVMPSSAVESYQGQLCVLAWERNQGRAVAEQWRAFTGGALSHPVFVAAEALSWALAGERELASNAYDELARREFPLGPGAFGVSTWAFGAEVASWLGDRVGTGYLIDRLAPYREELVVTGAGYTIPAVVDYSLGRALASLERWEEARSHFASAEQLARRFDASRWVRRCQLASHRVDRRRSFVGWPIRAVEPRA